MRIVYKVTVEANVYDDAGDFVRSEALYEGASPRPEALLRTAPVEVEDALRDLLPDDEDGETLFEGAPVVGTSVFSAPASPPAPKTRKRRTKAEIAADRAREAAKAQAADAPAPGASETAAPAEDDAPPAAAEVPAEPATAVAEPQPASAPPAPNGEPWNPFEQR